jgi:hypothetical protein
MLISSLFLAIAVASSVVALHAITKTTASASMPQVTLDYVTLQAAVANTTAGIYKYQDIRFAAAPTGELRFAPPQ